MFYHPESARIILFGGGRLTDTWSFNIQTDRWTLLNDIDVPDLKRMGGVRAAYDTKAQRMIVFFYKGAGLPGETWSYDPQTQRWENLHPTNQPLSRRFTDLVYDPQADRTLLFGGAMSDDETLPTNELWEYDYHANAWSQRHPSSSPPVTFFESIVYVASTDKLIVWGGKREKPERDLWIYSYSENQWDSLKYQEGPTPDYDGAMAYDTDSGLVFLYVGNHFWSYDPPQQTWQKRTTQGGPGMLFGSSMTYDPEKQRLIIFGGANTSPTTWFYDPAADRWSSIKE